MKQCSLLTCKNGGSRSAHELNILHFPRLVSVFKRESEASKATISVIKLSGEFNCTNHSTEFKRK